MARNQGNNSDEGRFYRRGGDSAATASPDAQAETSPMDSRFIDMEEEEQSPFLRAQKRVPVRRSALPKKTASRVWFAISMVVSAGLIFAAISAGSYYGTHAARFRLDSADNVQLVGDSQNSKPQVLEILRRDIGRNIFAIPLDERKQQFEKIPWVESASVMRLWPNHLQVQVKERTPVAFVSIAGRVELIDAHGVVMDLPVNSTSEYSFPVITGMGENEPLSTRAERMKIYEALIKDLDGTLNGETTHYSKDINEVDLSDPEDVKVTVADGSSAVLLHLGPGNFLASYKVYLANLQKWHQQMPRLESVDLRYLPQVIVNPDIKALAEAHPPQQPETPKVEKKPAPAKARTASAKHHIWKKKR